MPYLELRDYCDGASKFEKEMGAKIVEAADDAINAHIGIRGNMEFDYQRRSMFAISEYDFVLVIDMGKNRDTMAYQVDIAREIKRCLVEILGTNSCKVRLRLQPVVFI